MTAARRSSRGIAARQKAAETLSAAPGRPGPRKVTTDTTRAVPEPSHGRERRKYGNEPQIVDGQRFDSKKEAARYAELVMLERAGEITDLVVHPRFPLVVHDQDCGAYVGDFGYIQNGRTVVEDVKSAVTRTLPTYRLKAKLLWAIYGLRVREV